LRTLPSAISSFTFFKRFSPLRVNDSFVMIFII
jgi:hypothetical protein